MKRYIDLHMHTFYSDGVKTPEELIDLVRKSKVEVFSVTDHDTIDGFREIKKLVTEDDPKLITGVELSVSLEDGDMHILAYCFDENSDEFNAALNQFQIERNRRGEEMVRRLNALDVPLEYELVVKQARGTVIGRPHLAKALFDNGFTKYYEEAFAKYIGDNGPAYVPKNNFTPAEAISLIHNAGGLAVLAHPGINSKEKYIDILVENGLDGIEAYHSSHKLRDVERYKHLADKHRLLITGGSDYHGLENRYGRVGSQKVPYKYYELLEEASRRNEA